MQKSAKSSPAAASRIAGTLNCLKATDEFADRNPRLHPGERHACTGMNTQAERQVSVRRAVDIEPIWIGKLRGVAVGRADTQVNITLGWNGDAVQHRVDRGATIAKLVRAFHAHEFLDRRVDELGVFRKLLLRIGVAQQEIDAIADEVSCGLVPRVEEEYAVVDQLQFG
jgi:hypothetical protein